MKKHYLIYQITNKINGFIYIGKHETYNIDDSYFGSGVKLLAEQKRYGLENFEFKILIDLNSKDEMNLLEQLVVNEEFLKRDDVYNLTVGGNGGFQFLNNVKLNMTGNWKSIGQRCREIYEKTGEWPNNKRLQQLRKNLEWFANYKKNISVALKKHVAEHGAFWTGKHHTKESKEKIGQANAISQRGSKNSQYGTKCVYNEQLQKTTHVKSSEVQNYLDNGWKLGAVYNWELYFRKPIQNAQQRKQQYLLLKRQKAQEEKKQINIEERNKKIQLYEEMYYDYCIYGFDYIKEKYNYRYSQPNFTQQCKRYVKNFSSQNGKKRKIK